MRSTAVIVLGVSSLAIAAAHAQQVPSGWEAVVPQGMAGSYERNRYAPAVRIGNLVFVSGVIGYERGSNNGPAAQFERAFRRLEGVLAGAGLAMANVAEITTYHVNLGELGRPFITIKDRFFPRAPFPAWTAIGVERLFLDSALVEIRATAVSPPPRAGQ